MWLQGGATERIPDSNTLVLFNDKKFDLVSLLQLRLKYKQEQRVLKIFSGSLYLNS